MQRELHAGFSQPSFQQRLDDLENLHSKESCLVSGSVGCDGLRIRSSSSCDKSSSSQQLCRFKLSLLHLRCRVRCCPSLASAGT